MSRSRNNDSTATRVLVGAAAGALLGLAAYGVKKLYDEITTPEKESAYSKPDKKLDDEEPASASGWANPMQPHMETPERSLSKQLDHYLQNYVRVPKRDMDIAKDVVDDVKKMFLRYCQKNLPDIGIVALRDTGSASDGVKVVRPDEFDVMVHLDFDRDEWLLEESEAAPGYWEVRKQELNRRGGNRACLNERLLTSPESNVLSPEKVIRRFQGALQKMANTQDKYVFVNSVHGPAITLQVHYEIHGGSRHLDIDFVPTIERYDTWVVAKPHPEVETNPSLRHLWRQSFSFDEYNKLNRNPNLPRDSCHLKCLMILKAVRLNHKAQLGSLSSYVFKTVLLHLLDQEDDWGAQDLPERFLDMLMLLKHYLSKGELPNYFCPEMNILRGLKREALDNIKFFLLKRMDEAHIVEMLKRNY